MTACGDRSRRRRPHHLDYAEPYTNAPGVRSASFPRLVRRGSVRTQRRRRSARPVCCSATTTSFPLNTPAVRYLLRPCGRRDSTRPLVMLPLYYLLPDRMGLIQRRLGRLTSRPTSPPIPRLASPLQRAPRGWTTAADRGPIERADRRPASSTPRRCEKPGVRRLSPDQQLLRPPPPVATSPTRRLAYHCPDLRGALTPQVRPTGRYRPAPARPEPRPALHRRPGTWFNLRVR